MRLSPDYHPITNLKFTMISRLGGTGLLNQVHAQCGSAANSGAPSLHSRSLHISRKHRLLACCFSGIAGAIAILVDFR